jgi:phosphotransferase system IIA component
MAGVAVKAFDVVVDESLPPMAALATMATATKHRIGIKYRNGVAIAMPT